MTPATDPPTAHSPRRPLTVIVMGVSGCGKSSMGSRLAERLQAHFKDGDELHPPRNIDKMSDGIALDDQDRLPWLEQVARHGALNATKHGIGVIACSALKQRYREILRQAGEVRSVFLDGSRELIASRMHHRSGHFMPDSLLDSQFATLEHPCNEPDLVTVNIDADIPTIVQSAADALRLDCQAAHIDGSKISPGTTRQ